MLEQTFDDVCAPLGLDPKHDLGKPFGGRTAEQTIAFERGLDFRKLVQQRLDNRCEDLSRRSEILERDGPLPFAPPHLEERLEDSMEKQPLRPRAKGLLINQFFFEGEHVLGEET